MKRLVAIAAVAVAGLMIVALPGPAFAKTVAVQDNKARDAAPRFDIKRITYKNNAAAFSYRVKLRDIKKRNGTLIFPKLLVKGSWDQFFTVVSGARRDGTRFHRLELSGTTESHRVACPGMTGSVNYKTNVVTARVPQSCLGDLGQQAYKAVGYAATPGMSEAGDIVGFRWVGYN